MQLKEPDPASQQLPCSNQRVVYECRILVGSTGLTWILPTNDTASLEFWGSELAGTTRSSSVGQFIAVLDRSDSIPENSSVFLITSTLHIQPPLADLTGSTLICAGDSETDTITVTGERQFAWTSLQSEFMLKSPLANNYLELSLCIFQHIYMYIHTRV